MIEIVRVIKILMSLYVGGFATVEILKRLEKASIIKISKGMTPMREFNRKLFEK